jgi:hypothetical protein
MTQEMGDRMGKEREEVVIKGEMGKREGMKERQILQTRVVGKTEKAKEEVKKGGPIERLKNVWEDRVSEAGK